LKNGVEKQMVVSLQEHKGQYRLTIPREIVGLEKLQKGDKFRIVKIQGYLALEPVNGRGV
jgi:hypothetical protein